MKKGLTEIICVVDKSGSMSSMKNDAIGGFNEFLKQQREFPGKATFTLTLFDTTRENVYNGTDIKSVSELNDKTYIPNGATALLDAVGATIDLVGQRLAATPEKQRPEKVVFAILTDGEENSSHEYNLQQIKDKIEHQTQKYAWEFIFLGVGIEAINDAMNLGIEATSAFAMASGNIRGAYNVMSSTIGEYRSRPINSGTK